MAQKVVAGRRRGRGRGMHWEQVVVVVVVDVLRKERVEDNRRKTHNWMVCHGRCFVPHFFLLKNPIRAKLAKPIIRRTVGHKKNKTKTCCAGMGFICQFTRLESCFKILIKPRSPPSVIGGGVARKRRRGHDRPSSGVELCRYRCACKSVKRGNISF